MADNQFTLAGGFRPALFGQNIMNLSTATNRLLTSGILTPDPVLAARLSEAGEDIVTLPYTNDLEGDPQVLDDLHDIEVNGLTTGVQRVFRMRQAQAFGYTDISQILSVSDPRDAIAQRFAAYWNRVDQKTLLAILQGIFANTDIANAKLFNDSANTFNAKGFLATIGLLGDIQDQTFNKIAVNSSVYSEMKALNMLDQTAKPSDAVTPFGTYQGMTIVVDDDIPLDKTSGVATSYIFGNGAIGYSTAPFGQSVEVERESKKQGGRTNIINRRSLGMHVLGTSVAKTFTPAGQTPVTSDLASGATWESVVDPRNIKVVAYKAKVEDMFIPGKQATPKP